MKKIIFVRHARAEEYSSSFSDFERSLTTNGKKTSEKMALKLLEKEKDKLLFITSPAFRAYETAVIFARTMGSDPDMILLRNEIYTKATLNSFAAIFDELNDDINGVIMFGHNPSFTEIPDRLSKSGCDFLPKTGIVCLTFLTSTWKGIMRERGNLEYFLKPEKSA
ncbi:MAG TPA: histidine phosphatase family protein [Bacteroidales bacterium]|jgi:phosphohistidine phosphatase|nr:histidine phosphatase family protein [Bacteroidales bacterium]